MRETLRVGVIGLGNVGSRWHLPVWLQNPDVARVVGLADPTISSLEGGRVLAGLRPDQVHADPFDLIVRDDIDAVDVCTPQDTRRDLLVAALRSGKHVLCEKPIATVPAYVAEAVAEARLNSRLFAVVHNYLFLPEIVRAREIIESGAIGAVRAVLINMLGVPNIPGSAAYEARWRDDPRRAGGGVLMNMLHPVYLAEALLGGPFCRASAYIASEDGDAVESLALCRFETECAVALVNVGMGSGPGGLDIIGSNGRISISYEGGGNPPWSPLDAVRVVSGGEVTIDRADLDCDGIDDEADAPSKMNATVNRLFERVILNFSESILRAETLVASGEDGARTLDAVLAAYKAAVIGKVVSLPLSQSDPLFRDGVVSLRHLRFPAWSPLARPELFARSGVSRS